MTVQLVDHNGRPTTWKEIVAERLDEVVGEFQRPFVEAAAKRTGSFLRGKRGRIPKRTGRLRRGVRARGVVARATGLSAADLARRGRPLGRIEVKGSGPHYNRGTRPYIMRAVEGGDRMKPITELRDYWRGMRFITRRQLRKAAERTNDRRRLV